jgi:hypothetical protein
MRIFRLVCAIVFLTTLLPVGYLLSGSYFDQRAISKASEFCSLVAVDESLEALKTVAIQEGVVLEEWNPRPGGQERYIVSFPGFFANSVHCEISVVNKRVQARFVEEHFW